MYVLDIFSNTGGGNFLSAKLADEIGWRWEKRLYPNVDLILNMKSHEKHHNQDRYDQFRNKMEFVDIPLLKKRESENTNKKSKKSTLNIIYTGTLDKYKRNPQYACDVFKEIANIDFSLKFF